MMSATEAAPESGSNALLRSLEEHFNSNISSPLSELEDDGALGGQNGWPNGDASLAAAVKVEDDGTNGQISDNHTTPTTLRPHPSPSAKRRESEVAEATPELTDKPGNKKRKRGSSPPWHFPTAENTTLKTADGRRISARVNTSTPGLSENDGRARSSSLSAPPAQSRPPSPPWKKFEARGPTSMVVDGKRKSGRVNRELPEPGKRVSPRSQKHGDKSGESRDGGVKGATPTKSMNGGSHVKSPIFAAKKPVQESSRPSSASDSTSKIAELRAQIEALKPTRSFPSPIEQQPKRSHKRKHSHGVPTQTDGPASPPPIHRKHPRPSDSPEMQRPSPRIKLRFTTPRRVVPPPHPNAKFPSPTRPPSLSIFQQIEQFELQELQQPYTENERGPPDMSWFLQRAERQAIEEGAMRRRILTEAKSGGVLSKEKLSIYQDVEAQREPPKQYGHNDHLAAHAIHLRHLQRREKEHHRLLAKRVAHEALEFWKLKRGPTEEDIREEQDKTFKLIYKQCVADVRAKWELVAAHVQQQRLRLWEAEEELRRQQRLREKLEWSENMVARQRGEADDSEDSSGDGEDSEESEGEENMSESSSEASAEEEEEWVGGGSGSGEMGEDELAAYLAQRGVEPQDERADEEGDVMEVADQAEARMDGQEEFMTDAEDSEAPQAENQPENHPESRDVSMAELLSNEDDVNEDKEFEPTNGSPLEDAEAEHSLEHAMDTNHSIRRSRRSSAAPDQDHTTEAEFSSDESTDMDSTDYDSDEDMSSTGEEDNPDEGNQDGDGGQDSEDDQPLLRNSLLSLFKDEIKGIGLPTPTTSAEGDERERRSEEQEQVDAQAGAGATVDEGSGVDDEGQRKDSGAQERELTRVDVEDKMSIAEAKSTAEPTNSLDPATAPDSADEEIDIDPDTKHLVPSPSLLRGTLRSYQHAGLDWLASLYRNGTNGILADEMGLGKTIQTIALLGHLAEDHECWDTHLVIVPTSVILNWVTEFQKFLPGFRVLGYYGTAEERQAKRRGWVNDPHHENKEKRGYNVVITSYNVAMQDINALRNVQWHYLVLDEAHNIRNFNSQRWQVLIRLKTRARLMLTGTPLQNSLTELWSLLTFLTAGDDDPAHGSLEEFLSHWKEPVKEIFDRGVLTLSTEAQKVVDQLHVSLRPFLLRRLKSEVEKDLPKKTESVVVCKLSKRQRQLYQDYMGLADTRKSLTQGNAVTAGKVLLSLRRVCNHPDLFDPRPIQTSFAMERSVAEGFEGKERVVRRLLGAAGALGELGRVSGNEGRGRYESRRGRQLDGSARLRKEEKVLEARVAADSDPDLSTLAGYQALQRVKQRERKLAHLRSCIRASEQRIQTTPVYGFDLTELLTIHNDRPYKVVTKDKYGRVAQRSLRGWPALGRYPLRFATEHLSDWLLSQTSLLQQQSVQTAAKYAEKMNEAIVKFTFCTPVATAPILNHQIPTQTQHLLRASPAYPLHDADYAHEARIRSSIVFPDSRLLIYDSGKLQRLTHLLRDLQSRGSRSLIFTQMTGTLNILEQFLSLLNLPYLRLDGSTPVERRQLYSAEFNRPDSKFQCMILSSRAGGIGLNLTGASSVIFYDLDWNPQMDRQCMDRAHRIGQVRDVEVYKMVSERTVEENILRRAEQKSLLDQTVIQEGRFTTDFQREKEDTTAGKGGEGEGEHDDVAAAIERFLGGGNEKATTRAIESVEDTEDVAAAQQARKEERLDEEGDFVERSSKGPSGPPTPGHMHAEDGVGGEEARDEQDDRKNHLDSYMIRYMEVLMKDVPFIPPQRIARTDRHGRDRSHRAKRKR